MKSVLGARKFLVLALALLFASFAVAGEEAAPAPSEATAGF